MTVLP
jgi:hypothetical protein